MSRADGVLVVVLKRKPFEDIRDGVKREEYRGRNWGERLVKVESRAVLWTNPEMLTPDDFEPYHTLRGFLGYQAGRPMLERRIVGIRWGTPNPAWIYGIVSPGPCFIIELGEQMSTARTPDGCAMYWEEVDYAHGNI